MKNRTSGDVPPAIREVLDAFAKPAVQFAELKKWLKTTRVNETDPKVAPGGPLVTLQTADLWTVWHMFWRSLHETKTQDKLYRRMSLFDPQLKPGQVE